MPFQTWGPEPRCFDAPLDTPDGISVWQAVTFLTQTPDGLLSRLVEPLVGLTWGYSVADGKPTISRLARAAQPDWDGIRVTLADPIRGGKLGGHSGTLARPSACVNIGACQRQAAT
jgi:hypothetical protein